MGGVYAENNKVTRILREILHLLEYRLKFAFYFNATPDWKISYPSSLIDFNLITCIISTDDMSQKRKKKD